MRLIVTGAAGVIASHLSEHLVDEGHDVTGIDNFSPFYPRELKEANLSTLSRTRAFRLVEADLRTGALDRVLRGADAVLHLAGRPGVRNEDARAHASEKVAATIAVVDAMRRVGVPRLIFSSSSSVYAPVQHQASEQSLVQPVSPYARTKLAAENVCLTSGIDAVVPRYFTVYGPRQRPDMAFARFISSARTHHSAPLFGNRRQVRDFTYVDDVVEATVRALRPGRSARIYNVSGGSPTSLREAVGILASILGQPLVPEPLPSLAVEAHRTAADLSRIWSELDWSPTTVLVEGLRRQVGGRQIAAA
jgi:nucleoside-diphosphate-sugar epimerase